MEVPAEYRTNQPVNTTGEEIHRRMEALLAIGGNRAQRRSKMSNSGKVQQYRDLPDGGYMVLHPTRGWRRVCGARVAAQGRLARLKGLV